MDLQDFQFDRGRCLDGVRMPFGDATLIVASIYSPRFVTARNNVERVMRLRTEEGKSALTEDELHDVNCDLYAEAILLGWENITQQGSPLEPTLENRRHLLRSAPPIFAAVRELAKRLTPYSLARDEAAQKNSDRSSPGNAGGDRRPSDGLQDLPQEAA